MTEKGKKVYDIKAIPKDVQIHTHNPFVFDVQRKDVKQTRRSKYRPNQPNSTHSSSRLINIGLLWACRPVNGAPSVLFCPNSACKVNKMDQLKAYDCKVYLNFGRHGLSSDRLGTDLQIPVHNPFGSDVQRQGVKQAYG